jgi:outer membrane protein OmpA-like peptidoglycan-associated protein
MKRQHLASLVCSFLLPFTANAQSNVDVNAQIFQPEAGGGFFGVPAGSVMPHLVFEGGLFLNFAKDPVEVFNDKGEPVLSAVSSQGNLDLVAAIGLFDRIQLGFAFPVTLVQNGEDLTPIGSVGTVSGGKPGDLRLTGRVRLVGDPKNPQGLSLAFSPELQLPSGANGEFLSSDGSSFLFGLNAQYRKDKFTVGGQVGPHFQKQVLLSNVVIGNELKFGAGISYAIKEKATVLAEVDGAMDLIEQNLSHAPTELRAGAKLELAPGLWLPIGGGVALSKGVGAPDFRVLAGLLFSPTDQDPDKDSIKTSTDKCPEVPEDKDSFEDKDGCPELDNDKDTIADTSDQCPNQAEDADNFEDTDGCPELDNDKDNIADADDKCINEAEDKDNFEDTDGCPELDNDKDTIADTSDQCPNQAGLAEFNGCPDSDKDKDKITNDKDKCPDEAEDKDGFEDADGCPELDNDKDGYVDASDQCPNVAESLNSAYDSSLGKEDGDGCPDDKIVVGTGKIVIKDTIFFASNKATIQKRSFTLLDSIAQVINENPQIKKINVEGYTDDEADDTFNQELSEKRAQAVLEYLVKKGVDASRLTAKGFGETTPIEPTDGKKGKELNAARAKNRRVEFKIQ